MGGLFSFSGLVTGLDSNNIIQQLVRLERRPIVRLEERITALEAQREGIRTLRTQFRDLRNAAQDFRFSNVFDQFSTASSEETVLTVEASGPNPLIGAFEVDVLQLASATVATSSASLGSAINPAAALDSSGITTTIEAGTFTINGEAFTVDPTTDTLDSIISAINASAAGVTATYNAVTDKITVENTTSGNTSFINFGAGDDDSHLLTVLGLTQATQSGAGAGGATLAEGTRNLGAVDPAETLNATSFANGAVTAGSFQVNGITITVDPTTDSLSDIISAINDSDAGVSATYDTSTDTIRVVSKTLGSPTVGFTNGTSNFLSIVNLDTAMQTAGNDAQFTINGGATLTRNTNEISDAITDVTIDLLSVGASTVTVSTDDDAIVEQINDFLEDLNATVTAIADATGDDGALKNDGAIRMIQSFLRTTIFDQVSGAGSDFNSLLAIGISTGSDFNPGTVVQFELDEDAFKEALRDNRTNVANLFSNTSKNGVADKLFAYLDEATSVRGFLNQRIRISGIIDDQIRSANDRITRIEERVSMFEARLRRQFSQLERLANGFQQQGAALSGITSGGFRRF